MWSPPEGLCVNLKPNRFYGIERKRIKGLCSAKSFLFYVHLTYSCISKYNKATKTDFNYLEHLVDVNKIFTTFTKEHSPMLNILFAFFLFGMLCVLCGKGIYRVYKYQQAFTMKEYALLVALSIGTLVAIYMGMNKLEG